MKILDFDPFIYGKTIPTAGGFSCGKDKPMKAIFLDVANSKKPEVIELPKESTERLPFYYEKIGCSTIDIVRRSIGGAVVDIIVDDEGLLVPHPKLSATDSHIKFPLVGNLIICNNNDEGDEIGLTDEEIEVIMYHYFMGTTRDYPEPYYILKLD